MQAVTHIGPALGLVAGVQFATSLAGVNAPLVYLVALGIILLTGLSVIQLAKHLPSAGGYYTYVSRTVSPRAGLFTSVVFLLYEPAACFVNLAFTAYLTEQLLKSEYGFTLNWWIIFTVGILLIGGLLYLGVQVSARTLLLLGSAEIIILVALALSGLANPGPGGVNLSPFNPRTYHPATIFTSP
jgi:amino acid transporter